MQENSWESALLSAGLLYLVPSNTCLYQVPSPIKLGLYQIGGPGTGSLHLFLVAHG